MGANQGIVGGGTSNPPVITTVSSWTLDTGTTYYADITHNLGTYDVEVEVYDNGTKETVIPQEIVRTSTNVVRLYVDGNTEVLRVLIYDILSVIDNPNNYNIVTNPATPYTPVNNDLILWDCTAEEKIISLPNPVTSSGLKLDVQKTDVSINKVVINPFNTESISYTTSAELLAQGDSLTIVCNGVDWFII